MAGRRDTGVRSIGLRFGVFRNGLRIGEITTTKMIDEAFQVADINRGDIRMGDDVRLD